MNLATITNLEMVTNLVMIHQAVGIKMQVMRASLKKLKSLLKKSLVCNLFPSLAAKADLTVRGTSKDLALSYLFFFQARRYLSDSQ